MSIGEFAALISALATAVSAGAAVYLLQQLTLMRKQVNVTEDQLRKAEEQQRLSQDQFMLSQKQLMLSQEQLRLSIAETRLRAIYELFPNETYIEREAAAAQALSKRGVDWYHQSEELGSDVVNALFKQENAHDFKDIKAFLNFFEDFALALRSGLLEEESAYALMGSVVTRVYDVFKPLILHRRKEMDRFRAWIELELLAGKWKPKLLSSEAQIKNELTGQRKTIQDQIEDAVAKHNQELQNMKQAAEDKITSRIHESYLSTGVRPNQLDTQQIGLKPNQ